MSGLPTYSFVPWLRSGVANTIRSIDGDTSVHLRAAIAVELTVQAEKVDGTTLTDTVPKDVQLYGPGDVVGIDPRAIVKTDPRHWITNYEPNYLPYVEFYDEDFPWRYTPARSEGQRLRPWIALVVLKTSEFDERSKGDDQPLPSITLKTGVAAASVFPDPNQLWAWAHVHVNRDLAAGGDTANAAVAASLTATLGQNPDLAYSRLLSPRRLEPNTAYHAFLIPSFEAGRLAGLKRPVPPATAATASAWDANQVDFPYYFRWYFRTGALGDFEYLVDQLKPQPTDKRVGVRDLDVLHPGSNLPPIDEPESLQGVLALGGALKVPFATLAPADQEQVTAYDLWDESPYPHPFQEKLATLVNLADDYSRKTPLEVNRDQGLAGDYDEEVDPDPVITLPLYGRWHALAQRLLADAAGNPLSNNRNWVHELNLDPRFRVAAGLGTRVVQDKQEEFMDAAWQQVGDVVEANRKIREAELAQAASFAYYAKHLTKAPTTRLMAMAAPVNRRVMVKGVTLHHAREQATVAPVVTSTAFRKITRPSGTVAKRLKKTAVRLNQADAGQVLRQAPWIEKVNDGSLKLAPPKLTPKQIATVDKIGGALRPGGAAGALYELARHSWARPVVLVIALMLLVIGLLTGSLALAAFGIAAGVAFGFLNQAASAIPVVEFLAERNQNDAAVDALPASPDFRISAPGSGFAPIAGSSDSAEGARFKQALKQTYLVSSFSYAAAPRVALDLAAAKGRLLEQLHPDFSIPRRLLEVVRIPDRIRDAQVDQGSLSAVMAYPEIDAPMYQPLSKLSSELFLPNIHLIPENSISLLEPNQKFIEAYMTGVNHEMSRELLWREYPTDQRGSVFRQFWDVSGCYPGVPPPADVRERMRDIPPLHQWTADSELGDHNQRELNGDKAQLVLVIRGELLKRYPTAVIYAHRADWQQTSGVNDPTKERVLAPLSDAENDNPPLTKVKTPLFEAKVDPDIYFFGFDLAAIEARGGLAGTDAPGWFFVIKERPGEPRFGLDEPASASAPRLINWNDLSWNAIGTAPGACIAVTQVLSFDTYDPNVDQENTPIAADAQARWAPDTNAAMLAYILNQVPVMVAVHAARMLPEQTA